MSNDVTGPRASLSVRVAEEIRVAMVRRRTSGAALAKSLGVSAAWISYRLTGNQEIGLDDLERIADALDVKPGDLLPPIARYPSLAHLEHPPAVRILPIPVQRDPSQAGPTALALKRATDNLAASRVF